MRANFPDPDAASPINYFLAGDGRRLEYFSRLPLPFYLSSSLLAFEPSPMSVRFNLEIKLFPRIMLGKLRYVRGCRPRSPPDEMRRALNCARGASCEYCPSLVSARILNTWSATPRLEQHRGASHPFFRCRANVLCADLAGNSRFSRGRASAQQRGQHWYMIGGGQTRASDAPFEPNRWVGNCRATLG